MQNIITKGRHEIKAMDMLKIQRKLTNSRS
jgi:hypothetical protein